MTLLTRLLASCLLLICAFAAPAAAQPQAQVRVSARLSTGVVKLGSEVRLIVEVEGARAASIPEAPSVDGLRIAGFPRDPSVEESFSVYNGRQSQSRKLTWVTAIQPLHKGEFTIPSFTVRADGRDLATRELSLKVVEDLQGEELGFFEMDAPTQVAEGQPFTLELRFGWDVALDQSINYANLSLPWLGELAGLVELDAPASAPGTSNVELNLNSHDRIRAERVGNKTVGGRTFNMLRVRKRYIATRSGKLEFATSHFEFGRITENLGFFNNRPSEKQTYYKRFPAFDIEVVKLPDKDRPFDFSGAVGRVNAQATADRRDVDAGDSIKLSVEWTGDANLEFFDPPDLAHMEAFKNFRVYGTTDRKAYDRRTVTYDIAPISTDVHAIPPVPLSVYDPVKKAYVTVDTDPIDIRVRALKAAGGLGPEVGQTSTELDIKDIHTRPVAQRETPRPGTKTLLAALIGVPLLWLAGRTLVRRRGDPDAPRQRARRAARKKLARELASARRASQQARALERFLAARSGESEEAWLGRDVRAWSELEHPGLALSAEDARALADLNARLDERTYAGGDEALDAALFLEMADRLVKGGL
jgi:hypothetical protein